ncbi:MAG: MarR family winged helix-turn-helix transcriptional regulator [Phenylobacterium sp.]
MPFSAAPMTNSRPPKSPDQTIDPQGELPLGASEYFFYLLFQVARQRDLFCDKALASCGLNMAQWRSLAIIRRMEICTMSSLARYSTIERTTLTRAVDQLVGRGLITRWVPETDRRQVNLSLSDMGQEAFARGAAILDPHNLHLLNDEAPAQVRHAMAVLQNTLRKLAGNEALAADLLNFGGSTQAS